MVSRNELWTQCLLVLPTGLAMTLFALQPDWLAPAQNWLCDGLAKASAGTAGSDVVIVGIDEESLAAHGRWPWPWRKTAEFVRALAAAGPSVMALAMVFSEPGEGDGELAGAMSTGRVVAGYSSASGACLAHPLPPEWTTPGTRFGETDSRGCIVPQVAAALADSGFLNSGPDADGVLRRVPLLAGDGERLYPHFALAAVRAARPLRLASLTPEAGGMWELRWNDAVAHLDGHGQLLPRLRPESEFPYFSAAEVLAGRVPAGALAGKIVVAGVTAHGFGNARVTALHAEYSTLAFHASTIDSLLRGGAPMPRDAGLPWEAALILLVGLGTALMQLRWIAAAGGGVAVVTATVYFATGTFVSPLLALLALATNAAAAQVRAIRDERESAGRAAGQVKAAHDFMLAALASLTTLRDVETGEHLQRVQRSLRLLCDSLRTTPRYRALLHAKTVEMLVAVAPIHDIGKIGVPDGVLQKTGRLTVDETTLIREHVRYGRTVLDIAREKSGLHDAELFAMCQALVYSHHERWDGSGYPDGLQGEAIPLPARLLAVVDVYDAMATRRVYKPAIPHDVVVAEIAAGRGSLFDPDIVDAFLTYHERFRQVYAEDEKRAATIGAT